jgi:hypothetical protein
MKNLKKTIMDKGNYLILSKILINNLKSLEAATLLGYLIEQQEFYKGKSFFKSHNDIQKAIFIQRHSYEKAKALLVEEGLINSWVEKRITYFLIDDECYDNIERLLNDDISEPNTNQRETQNNPVGLSTEYVENNKPYVENNKPYVENNEPICRNQQIGLLKSTSINNINNNIKEDNNNLLNNDFLVEEDGDVNILKELFDIYKDEKSLELELKVEYRILFNKLKSEKYYHIDKYRIEEYGIL